MASVNKVILLGHVGKDPDIRGFENGRSVANFTLATNESYKNRDGDWVERTEWHNIVMWTPLAERVEKDVRKGTFLYVEGRIQTRSYDDKEGNKRYITEVNGREMRLLSSRSDMEARRDTDSTAQPRAASSEGASSAAGATAAEEPDPDQVDDLPF